MSSTSNDPWLNGPYAQWIANAVKTTNPARLAAFRKVFDPTEPLAPYLKFEMVNTIISSYNIETIGVTIEPDHNYDNQVQDWGEYTDPSTGDIFRYGYVLRKDGYFVPGKFWKMKDGSWLFFPFDRQGMEDNDKWPIDSGYDMDNLAFNSARAFVFLNLA